MSAVVSLSNVTKSYSRGKQKVEVLHGVDLEISAGEFLALMGPSGSGKTTMLNLIAGLDQPTSGEVSVAGNRIDKLSRGALADWRAVSARLREIATLRAMGFGATAMVMSVLVEALVLALIGGLTGALIAWLFFNGHVVSSSAGGPAAGHLIFELTVSWQLVAIGIVWACLIGLIGGLFPAVRAARLPVATALRAVA